MSMSDESRSRNAGMRNPSSHSGADVRNNRSAGRGSALGGGSPTGLSGAMFGGGMARMPSYQPVTRSQAPAAQAPVRSVEPAQRQQDPFGTMIEDDPFSANASDPFDFDPFGLKDTAEEEALPAEDDYPANGHTDHYASNGDAAYAEEEQDFGYGEQAEEDAEDYGYDAAPASGQYGASGANEEAYLDDPFSLEEPMADDEQDVGPVDLSSNGNNAAYGHDTYANGRGVYADTVDLDDQPFELSESEYDPNYDDGYRPTTDAEIDEYIARAQRAVAEPKSRPQPQAAAPRPRSRAIQAFDAPYDQQRPEIALGSFSASRKAPKQRSVEEAIEEDADFAEPEAAADTRRFPLNRGIVMVASALVGVVVLGGALAYAYRAGNVEVASGQAPIVEADGSPVKVAPENGGGEQVAGGNKLIYDRLGGESQPGSEQIVPRQEEVAAANMPNQPQPQAAESINLPNGLMEPALPGASEGVQPMPGAESDPPAQVAADPNGPRRVATYVVRPDGTVVQPEEAPAQAEQAVAAIPQGEPAQAQQAAAVPSDVSQFVVQVGARKSQEEALTAFAELQGRYPQLLSGYRPMVQKADLGDKGTWYRLRVGPMAEKTAAAKLCSDLKSQGLPSCLVMTE